MATRRGKAGAEDRQQNDDSGLGEERQVPNRAVALKNDVVRDGVIVRFAGTEPRNNGDFDRKQNIHVMELGTEYGRAQFAVWGSMQLDAKLREIRPGKIILLQYQGKDGTEKMSQHQWSVREFHGTPEQLVKLTKQYDASAKRIVAELEKRGTSSSRGEAYDSDLPF